mgnify:CR=1 FL=1
MQKFNNKDVAIITTEAVGKTYENQNAFLQGIIKIVKDDEQAEIRTYKVRTDLVGYQNVEVPESGEDDQQASTPTQKLVWLEQKQDWSLQTFKYAEIDSFMEQLSSLIPSNLPRTQRDKAELATMFLIQRQSDAPWGIPAEKWRIRTAADLLKEDV